MTDQSGDEAAAGTVAGPDQHSLDRRSLLKKVGIAGAAAWVAPVVIESLVSPAAAASIPPGTYRLRMSSALCDPTPLLDPDAVPPPANCTQLAADYPATDFSITTQSQLDNFDIVVSNCTRRHAIQLTTSNPKVTFTEAGSGSAGLHKGECVIPTITPTQVTWVQVGATDRNGYYIIMTVAP
jgi:hypothetical protein